MAKWGHLGIYINKSQILCVPLAPRMSGEAKVVNNVTARWIYSVTFLYPYKRLAKIFNRDRMNFHAASLKFGRKDAGQRETARVTARNGSICFFPFQSSAQEETGQRRAIILSLHKRPTRDLLGEGGHRQSRRSSRRKMVLESSTNVTYADSSLLYVGLG